MPSVIFTVHTRVRTVVGGPWLVLASGGFLVGLHPGHQAPNRGDEQHARGRAREVGHVVRACDPTASRHLRLLDDLANGEEHVGGDVVRVPFDYKIFEGTVMAMTVQHAVIPVLLR